MKTLRALLWLNLAPQALLGVLGFALNPGGVLPELGAGGVVAMRLAAFSNVPQVILSAILLKLSYSDVTPVTGLFSLLRAWVLALSSYHALAGAQAGWLLWSQPDTAIGAACQGPAIFHAIYALGLGLGAWRAGTPDGGTPDGGTPDGGSRSPAA